MFAHSSSTLHLRRRPYLIDVGRQCPFQSVESRFFWHWVTEGYNSSTNLPSKPQFRLLKHQALSVRGIMGCVVSVNEVKCAITSRLYVGWTHAKRRCGKNCGKSKSVGISSRNALIIGFRSKMHLVYLLWPIIYLTFEGPSLFDRCWSPHSPQSIANMALPITTLKLLF